MHMDLKILLLNSLSEAGLQKKRQRLSFNNRCYTIIYQVKGRFLTVKNIQKKVKKSQGDRYRVKDRKVSANQVIPKDTPVRQYILVDAAVQTQNPGAATIQCQSTEVETEKLVTEEKAQQTVLNQQIRPQATQTELIKFRSEGIQTLKNTDFQVTQTETKFLWSDKCSQTNNAYTSDEKTQTDKCYLTPDKKSQTSNLTTTNHSIQTIPGYGMPAKSSQTPHVHAVDCIVQTEPAYRRPDKRSQTSAQRTANNKTQSLRLSPNKKSQTLRLVTTDHTMQTIPGNGMPAKKTQTTPLSTTDRIIQTALGYRIDDEKSENDFYPENGHIIEIGDAVEKISPVRRLRSVPVFISDRSTQTDKVKCEKCANARNVELDDNQEQAKLEKEAVVLMLNEIGELIINQNYLLHNNSTILGQISKLTLLQKMVASQNSSIKLRTKLTRQRRMKNYMRERSKKIQYVYFEATKLTKTRNVLLQTVEYQLNVSTQTKKEDFINRKKTKVQKLFSPLSYKLVPQESQKHLKY